MYCAYVTTIKELKKHPNADRLQCVEIFGNNTIVDLSYYEGQRVIYFPVDGQLSEEFAADNNLVKKSSEESATNIMDAFGQNLMATEAYSFSPTVRPVLDLDSFNQDYSKFSSIMDAGYSKNLSGSMHTYTSFDDSLLNALENLGDNSDVVDEVRSLSGRIADMTQQIGKMQVVLDSGTMVGALVTPLDQALGNKAIRSRRERR